MLNLNENTRGIFTESFKIGMEKFKADKPAQELHKIFNIVEKELQEIYEYVYIIVLPEYTINSTKKTYSVLVKHNEGQLDTILLMKVEINGDYIKFNLFDSYIEPHYLNAFDDLSNLMNIEANFYRMTACLKRKNV